MAVEVRGRKLGVPVPPPPPPPLMAAWGKSRDLNLFDWPENSCLDWPTPPTPGNENTNLVRGVDGCEVVR